MPLPLLNLQRYAQPSPVLNQAPNQPTQAPAQGFDLESQLNSLSPQHLEALKQELIKIRDSNGGQQAPQQSQQQVQQQPQGKSIGQIIADAAQGYAGGSLLALQGRPITELNQLNPSYATNKLLAEEQIRNKVEPSRILAQKQLDAINNQNQTIIGNDNQEVVYDKYGNIDTGKSLKIKTDEQQQQDKLENNAISRIASIRGDTSMARIETQRDASIQAYNLINEIKAENRMPSQVEYYDLLGQLWKSRTGTAPTEQSMRDLDAKTFQGNMAKMVQYFTGKPAGVTTPDILENLQSFVKKTGSQLDQLHDGYMQTHLIKPSGLDESRWQEIKKTNRGLSFKEASQAVSNQLNQQINQSNQVPSTNIKDFSSLWK